MRMAKKIKRTLVKNKEGKRDLDNRGKYIEGIGRRKTAIARVRIYDTPGNITVNKQPYNKYFPVLDMQGVVEDAFRITKLSGKMVATALIKGGGIQAQAEAFRHGLSRALIKHDHSLRDVLKKEGYLKRDPRMKERKKFGLKKARRAPQWSKR